MKFQWYFSFLIFTLAFVGLEHHQTNIPNQEVVVQFVDVDVATDQAENTILSLKKQLEELGVNNIKAKVEEGKLTISYYSDIDAFSIKKVLSNLGSSNKKSPSKDTSKDYNLDVYVIQKQIDSQWDFTGTVVIELKPDADRFYSPKVYASIKETNIQENIVKTAFKIYNKTVFATNNSLYKIPEVRAGPLA